MDTNYFILNMNPGYDRWLMVTKESPFETVIRADSVQQITSGKGTNIGRIFSVFGNPDYRCLSITGGPIGQLINDSIAQAKINNTSFNVGEESRINFSIYNSFSKKIITYNEPGPKLTSEEVAQFIDFVKSHLKSVEHPALVISGSAPLGFTKQDLLTLATWANENGIKVCVDIGGEWLKEIVKTPLEILKINREEFSLAFGFDCLEAKKFEKFRSKHAIKNIIITDGKKGSYAWDSAGKSYYAQTSDHPQAIGFTVGCGDSFFAGYLLEVAKGSSFKLCFLMANAFGVANTLKFGPGIFDKEDVEKSIDLVDVKELF